MISMLIFCVLDSTYFLARHSIAFFLNYGFLKCIFFSFLIDDIFNVNREANKVVDALARL